MSIYTDCMDAAQRLFDDPSQRITTTDGPVGIITELDVMFLAAREHTVREGRSYNEDELKLAQHEASQVMGALFRRHQAVRYGPVKVPGYTGSDYVRIASKIVYARPDGPEALVTPNGTFPRIFVYEDSRRVGRRFGADRNDFLPWSEQDILKTKAVKAITPEAREILRLKTENAALHEALSERDAEVHRLRERLAQVVTKEDVKQMIADQLRRSAA